jgi:hypothetical protein
VQVFDMDLVDIGRDGRFEGVLVLPPEFFGMRRGAGTGNLGGMHTIRKDAEHLPGTIGLAKERVDGGRHRRSLLQD